MNYDLSAINKIIGGTLIRGLAGNDLTIKHLLIDTRKALFPNQSCFFALPGPRRNGHQFIDQAYSLGVRLFVIDQPIEVSPYPEAHFIIVEDTITALQKLAVHHRAQFKYPVIGITGSNGKTIIKEWLFSMLQQDYNIVRSPGSFNSQIGVPLSIWQMKEEHQIAIIEAGISSVNEMEKLQNIIRCDTGILVNIGSAHDIGFQNREEKLKEKAKLFSSAGQIIYFAGDSMVHDFMSKQFGPTNKKLLNWGDGGEGTYFFSIISSKTTADRKTILSGWCNQQLFEFLIPFDQPIDVQNAIHCIVYLLSRNYDGKSINERLSLLRHLEMRLEFRKGIRNSFIINDTYSNDPESLKAALSFLQQQAGSKPKALIISGFREQINENDKDGKEMIYEMIHKYSISLLVGVGEEIKDLCNRLKEEGLQVFHFDNTEELIKAIHRIPIDNKAILCKASRSYALDRLIPHISAHTHNVRLLIDLEAMRHNVRTYTQKLKANTKLMIMLKAHAYGSGDIELARFFEELKADYLAVAVIDEAVELRKAGIQTPILVLNPDPEYCEVLVSNKLSVEIFSLTQLKELMTYLKQGEQLNLHLKLDTGLHRLGMEADDFVSLFEILEKHPIGKLTHVFTHLACASDPACDSFTEKQIALFNSWHQLLENRLGAKINRHVLNSSGIIRFPHHQMEMVRLGIGLYGVSDNHLDFQPVHTLAAKVVQIKKIQEGETVGYDRTWTAARDTTMAVINIGYADGLMRRAGNGRFSLQIKGQMAPIIGLICMDMCMVDITDTSNLKVGDDAIVFGPDYPISILAKACETSAYEILSRLSPRIDRIYVNTHY